MCCSNSENDNQTWISKLNEVTRRFKLLIQLCANICNCSLIEYLINRNNLLSEDNRKLKRKNKGDTQIAQDTVRNKP